MLGMHLRRLSLPHLDQRELLDYAASLQQSEVRAEWLLCAVE
ncbi:hypothetical protein [Mumia zhuanghuii]|nr:hypothetical protein [Mumia zhuanghuii]